MSITRLERQRGLSLIELIVFIVVIGVAVVGVLVAITVSTRSSTDPMVQKQALAIAEALLEEVELQPFTYCDPDDTVAATALSSSDCTGGTGGANDENRDPLGPETGESRTSSTNPFDNVSDYTLSPSGLAISPITDIAGTPMILDLTGYSVTILVAKQGIPGVGTTPAISSNEALLITVTVAGPGNTTVTLHGYRTRYAPNALP